MPNPLTENPFKHLSKTQATFVVIGSVGIGGFFVYSHHKSTGSWNPFSGTKSAANSANDPTAIDPVTGLAYSMDNQIDPITNLPYLAEAQQYGSVATAEATVSAYGQTTNSGTGVVPPSPGSDLYTTNTGAVTSSPFTSNAAWAQAVTAGLAAVGYSETDVATAIGDYLTETPVTPAQAQLIRAALAEFGNPPVGTFQIIPVSDKPPGTTMVTVPELTGKTAGESFDILKAVGLVLVNPDAGTGEATDKVTSQTPKSGTQVTKGSKVTVKTAAGGKPPPPPNNEVTVPHVIGESQALAFDDLQEAGLKATGSRVVKGSVVWVVSQNPKAGTKVKRGTTVHLVSKERKG